MAEEITQEQIEQTEAVDQTSKEAEKQQEDLKKSQTEADAKAVADQANQAMAGAMYEIEDNLRACRKKLDAVLGRVDNPKLDPDSPEFDFKMASMDVDALMKPLTSVSAPLVSITGPIPVVGQIPPMIAKLQQSVDKSSEVDPNLIKEMCPEKPEIPPGIKSELGKIADDAQALCTKLPMLHIKIIYAMVKLIYDKLSIITSIIPLGSMFPLSLVGKAIQAEQIVEDFVTNFPSKVKGMVEGAAKQVSAAQTALAVPQPPSASQLASAAAGEATEKAVSATKSAADKIASPVKSNIQTAQPKPSTPEPIKDLEGVEEEWKGEFAKLPGTPEWNGKEAIAQESNLGQYAQKDKIEHYIPYVKIDDDFWTALKKAVELESKCDPKKANQLFKTTYVSFTNQAKTGYKMVEFADYRGYDKKDDGTFELNDDGKKGKYMKKIAFMPPPFLDGIDPHTAPHRLKYGDSKVSEHIESLHSTQQYKDGKPAYKKAVDEGIGKYSEMLDKHVFIRKDQLPDVESTLRLSKISSI